MHNPDVVFLDIQLKNGNGFDLFDKLPEVNFEVVFTTAYDNRNGISLHT
jgi:two-component system LytT family response regulator